MKKLLLIFLFAFSLLSSFKEIKAQGALYCYLDSFDNCALDRSIDPNPDCQLNYSLPENCDEPGEYQTCCNEQSASSCSDIPCICSFSTCPSGNTCTGLDPGLCASAGGSYQNCSTQTGSCGTCCQPEVPTPTGQPTSTPWPDQCPSNYSTCDYIGGGQINCELNGGVFQNCTSQGGSSGNCCLPGEGTYFCEWDIAENMCVRTSNIEPPLYNCGANWGACPIGDPTCTSCDEAYGDMQSCIGGNALRCVEQNETIGYYCAGTTLGCYPCFEDSTDYRCDPELIYTDYAICQRRCSGQDPVMYTCTSDFQCLESGSGTYDAYTCATECVRCGGWLRSCCESDPPCQDGSLIPLQIQVANLSYCICIHNTFAQPTSVPIQSPGMMCNPSDGPAGSGIESAIGCISVLSESEGLNPFTRFVLSWAIGIGGGIAFVLSVFAGFILVTSQANPQRLAAGKELLVAALSGLGFLIFSVFVLRIIGVDILLIPGF